MHRRIVGTIPHGVIDAQHYTGPIHNMVQHANSPPALTILAAVMVVTAGPQ